MTNQPSVLAVVLNWRQPSATLKCVRALQAMAYPCLEILVIDNGSGDESLDILQNELLDIRLKELPENLGFARGCNIGIKQAIAQDFDYVLLVNNDAYPAVDMLAKLLEQVSPDIALLSPKIYYESEPKRLWFGNGIQDPNTLDLRNTGRGQIDGPLWSNSRDVDYLLGTCLLINLSVVQSIGLFDERFFMYFEDLDWSLRVRKAGFRLRLVATAHLYHRVAISSGGLDSPIRRFHLARSSIIFWRKHARSGNILLISLFRLGSAIKMIVRLLLRGKKDAAIAYLRGLQDGWRIMSDDGWANAQNVKNIL